MKAVSALTKEIKTFEELPRQVQQGSCLKIEIPDIQQIDSTKKWAIDVLNSGINTTVLARKWAEAVLKDSNK